MRRRQKRESRSGDKRLPNSKGPSSRTKTDESGICSDNGKVKTAPFGWLPNRAAEDRNLDAAALCLLALRLTFATERANYALNENAIVKAVARGRLFKPKNDKRHTISRRVVRRCIGALARLGYTERHQTTDRGPGGVWLYARETTTAKAQATRANGRHVRRDWFDGRWTLDEMGLVLWLRAVGDASLSEICARFQVCRSVRSNQHGTWRPLHRGTAAKLIKGLIASGHVIECDRDRSRGRIFKAASLGKRKPADADAHVENGCNGEMAMSKMGATVVSNLGATAMSKMGATHESNNTYPSEKKHVTCGAAPLAGGPSSTALRGAPPASDSDSLPACKTTPRLAGNKLTRPARKKNHRITITGPFLPHPPAGKEYTGRGELYRRGDAELGPGSGGLITKALKVTEAVLSDARRHGQDDLGDAVSEVNGMLDYVAEHAEKPRAAFAGMVRSHVEVARMIGALDPAGDADRASPKAGTPDDVSEFLRESARHMGKGEEAAYWAHQMLRFRDNTPADDSWLRSVMNRRAC